MPSRLDLIREHQWRRSREDPIFFIETFGQVLSVGRGWVPFKLWPVQKEIIEAKYQAIRRARDVDLTADEIDLGERHCDLKSRQIGFTTLTCALTVQDMMFNEDHPWILVAQGLEEAKGTLATKVSQFYSRLPRWLRDRGPAVEVDTKELFGFSNGSSILSIPSTAHSARSKAVFGVIFDEAAHMEDPEGVLAALDPLCYGPLFMFSTANGMGNLFHQTYLDAKEPGSIWVSSFYDWRSVPGRTQKWYEAQQRKLRHTPHIVAQEHPRTDAEAFLRSGRVALDVESIELKAHFCPPLFTLDATLLNLSRESLALAVIPPEAEPMFGVNVWVPPRIERNRDGTLHQKPNYVISCDSAEGLEHGDMSAIVVADALTGERCATMRSRLSIHHLGPLLEILGYWYHTGLIIVERNASGLVPLEYLRQAGYPRMYRQLDLAAIQLADRTPRYGWVTSSLTKPTMVHDWNKAIEEDRILLHDRMVAIEASTFIVSTRGRFGAKAPNHDDLIMAEFLVQQGVEDSPRFPPVFVDPEPGPPTFAEIWGNPGPGMRKASLRGTALAKPIGDRVAYAGPRHSFEMRSPHGEFRSESEHQALDSGQEPGDTTYVYDDPRAGHPGQRV